MDFLDLSDVDDPSAFVARFADRIDVGFFGLQASDLTLIDDLDAVARWARPALHRHAGRPGQPLVLGGG